MSAEAGDDLAEHTDVRTIRLLLVVSIALITFVAFEALAVATAMPTVSRALDGGQLYALAYGITLATQVATTTAAGRWCDAGGTRAALVTGIVTFITGLALAGLAPDMWLLVLGRAVQGVGGALVIVPLYVLVGTVVPARRRPGFFAAFSAAWVVPSLVGPLLAGFLADHVSWRWVFLGIAAVAVPAMFLVLAVFARLRRDEAAARAAAPNVPDVPRARPVSTPGEQRGSAPGERRGSAPGDRGGSAILVAVGAGTGAALLQSAGSAPGEGVGLTASDWILLGLGTLVLLACLPRLLPGGALRLRARVPALVTGRALLNGAYVATQVYLVLLLQEQHGWDAMSAGSVLTVGSLSWGAASVVAARVRTEATRARLPWIGSSMLAAGIAVAIPTSWPDVPAWLTIVSWVVAGGGIGLAMSSSSVLALGWTPRARQGEVSAHLQIADALGPAVLVALTGVAVAVAPPGALGQVPYVAALGIGLVLALLSATASYRSQGDRSTLATSPA
ncbi:MFS transporter [Georgenia sp. Z1491]|uniref:MFS transporter n=1 Tax=Georgenia sp. Z1491 TaxID=3416707 RepID=UPI003CF7BDB3